MMAFYNFKPTLILAGICICLSYSNCLCGVLNYDNDPDLDKALKYDLEMNGGKYKVADRTLAEKYYLTYLKKNPDVESFQKARIYAQLGALYTVAMNPRLDEKRDLEKARLYFEKVLECEPERIGHTTLRARNMLVTLRTKSVGFNRLKARVKYYEFLDNISKLDKESIKKLWLPKRPVLSEDEHDAYLERQISGIPDHINSVKHSLIYNAVKCDAIVMDVPIEGLTYMLEHLPDNAPERKIVKKAMNEPAEPIVNEMLKKGFAVRTMNEQVVLYTIYRGPYNQMGSAIGKLFALAGQKGLMPPRGPVTYKYLNNPTLVSSEHWLTEIRIPVAEDALKLVGKLGEMTDVKKVPTMKMVVAVKPEGLADPGTIYNRLIIWIHQNNYTAIDGFREIFLTNTMSGDYSMMKSEIMAPIEKLADLKLTGCDN